jgi:hypothetical protein
MKGKLRGILEALLLPAFGVLVAAGVLELAVRSLHLLPDQFWEPDPVLGRRLIPGKDGWWSQEGGEFRVHVSINGAGLRDVERQREKPAGVRRVLLLGDSFIEAMQVPLEQTIGRQLEQALNAMAGARRYEVVAVGTSGYGTAAEWLWYQREGRSFNPDIVLLAFYPGNDVRNNSPTLEPALRPEYRGDKAVRIVALERTRKDSKDWRRLLFSSHAYRFVRRLLLTQHADVARSLAGAGLIAPEAISEVPLRGRAASGKKHGGGPKVCCRAFKKRRRVNAGNSALSLWRDASR